MSYLDGKFMDSSGIVWLCLRVPPPSSWVVEMIWSPSQRVTKPVPAEIFRSPRPEILSLMFHGIWACVQLKLQPPTLNTAVHCSSSVSRKRAWRSGAGQARGGDQLSWLGVGYAGNEWHLVLGAPLGPALGVTVPSRRNSRQLGPAQVALTLAYTIHQHQQYHSVQTILHLNVDLIPGLEWVWCLEKGLYIQFLNFFDSYLFPFHFSTEWGLFRFLALLPQSSPIISFILLSYN